MRWSKLPSMYGARIWWQKRHGQSPMGTSLRRRSTISANTLLIATAPHLCALACTRRIGKPICARKQHLQADELLLPLQRNHRTHKTRACYVVCAFSLISASIAAKRFSRLRFASRSALNSLWLYCKRFFILAFLSFTAQTSFVVRMPFVRCSGRGSGRTTAPRLTDLARFFTDARHFLMYFLLAPTRRVPPGGAN